MPNFCTKCGSPLDIDSVFCPKCGAKIRITTNLPDTKRKNIILKKGFLLAGILIVILIFSSVFGDGYESVPDDLFEGIEDAEPHKIIRVMPDCEIEKLEKSLREYDVYTSAEDYIAITLETMLKTMASEYGDDISISYDIIDRKELSESKLKDIENQLKIMYNAKDTEASKGYSLKLDVEIEGDNKTNNKNITIDVAKVDGKWCLVGNDFYNLF
ncbi:MAG: zinc-ribbon domain-containing protein [Ruminococcus sp.]|nr:zinc-ribbon domain-containing protein [Ruminococcus sp.]